MIIFGSSLYLPYDLKVEVGSPIWAPSIKQLSISEKCFQEMTRFTWIRDTNTNGSILPKQFHINLFIWEVVVLYFILWQQTASFCCPILPISRPECPKILSLTGSLESSNRKNSQTYAGLNIRKILSASKQAINLTGLPCIIHLLDVNK